MVIQCRMCGGDLLFSPGDTYGRCANCGRESTIPNVSDERKLNLFRHADQLRRQHEFDRAMDAYGEILKGNMEDAEAHWGVVLSRYGIEYVDDPATGKRVPTCHRTQMSAILADEDYKAAIQYASDPDSRRLYEEEAGYIAEVQKGILAISRNEQPYDVFICYKEADDNGQQTEDSALAWDIYDYLTVRGFKVFFSRVTLQAKLGHEYEPYIFAALHSASVMLVIGTRPEYFNAVWVKNEWSRYLALKKQEPVRLLIPCFRDMDPSELPVELAALQSQDMNRPAFKHNLGFAIQTAVSASKNGQRSNERTESSTVASLLDRAFFVLESGDFEKADALAEKALDSDYQSARAYLVKLMIECKARFPHDLANEKAPLTENNNYKNALQFADPALKAQLEGWNQEILERIEKEKREAEERRRREAEAAEKAQREAEERKRREAEAAEKVRREAEERKRREAEDEEKARREAEERRRRVAEAVEKARREAEERKRKEAEAYEKKKKLEEDFRLRTEQYQKEETVVIQLKREQQQLEDALKDAEARYANLQQQLSQLKGLFVSAKRKELEQQIERSSKAKARLELQLKNKKAALEIALKRLPEAPDPMELDNQIGTIYRTAGMYGEAVEWYLKAAKQGQAKAQYNLGDCFNFGQGVYQNYHEAVKWYRKAAEQGDAMAQCSLGYCYNNGQGVSKDSSEAIKWYRRAAEQGDATAQCNLGYCYENGKGVPQDYSEAVKWYRKSADQGYAKAQCSLGCCYENGKGVLQNYSETIIWYRKAAEQGYAIAQCNLGYCYEIGRGVSQNYFEAVKWYRKAAEQGYARAQYNLGLCYEVGRGVPQDYTEAVKWYCKAAEQGNAYAQYGLGVCYENGHGVTQDSSIAVKWYRKAVEQGLAVAQNALGVCYYNGRGVSKDYFEAVEWYRKAAEQGHAWAQYHLGWCYEKGQGISKNNSEAVKWYRKSAEQNNECASSALKRLQ